MSTYRKEWPCCGDVTETDAWTPGECPFCSSHEARAASLRMSERVRELEEALYGMVGLFRGTCGLKGWNQSDYIEFTNALAALKESK